MRASQRVWGNGKHKRTMLKMSKMKRTSKHKRQSVLQFLNEHIRNVYVVGLNVYSMA